MFLLTKTPLDVISLNRDFGSNQAGAFVCFEGRVRDHHEGFSVTGLEYQAHEPLCQTEANKILKEAKNKFNIIDLKCSHRVGLLKVGDIAVWVGVIAAHRDDAFQACRYTIDEVKNRLPIWKKEIYANGESKWVNCQCQGHKTMVDSPSSVSHHSS